MIHVGASEANPPARFPALTGMRAFAAALVYFHHFYSQWYIGRTGLFERFLAGGSKGVFIFFTLSGYLITKTYYRKLLSGEMRFRTYFLRRFARIYPGYLFLLLIKYLGDRKSVSGLAQVVANLTLTQSYFPRFTWTGLFPTWSLGVEECFYASAPLLYLLFSKLKLRKLGVATALLAVCVSSYQLFRVLHHLKIGGFLSKYSEGLHFNIFFCWPFFAVGVFSALFAERVQPGGKAWKAEAAFLASIALLVLMIVLLARPWMQKIAPWENNVLHWLVGPVTVLMIWAIVSGSKFAGQLLGNPIAVYLGKISFMLYLLQEDFFSKKLNALLERVAPWSPHYPLLFYAALSVLAVIAYEAVERPAHRFINSRLPLDRPLFGFESRGDSGL